MKKKCEKYQLNLGLDAYFCVHDYTFCEECAKEMYYICPNCSGELVNGQNQLDLVRISIGDCFINIE